MDNPSTIKSAIEFICQKYEVKSSCLKKFCLNRYFDPKTKNIFVINNRCQCAEYAFCNTCEDFWSWEWDHPTPHTDCYPCEFLTKYYEAQKELYDRFQHLLPDESVDKENSFSLQRRFSTAFNGTPRLLFEELTVID